MRSNYVGERERLLNILTLFDGGCRDTVGYLIDEKEGEGVQSDRNRTHLQRISVVEV